MKNLIYALCFLSFMSCDESQVYDPLSIEMVLVEGGEYDKSAYPDKYPETGSYKVQLNSYRIGKYEITQAQWEAIMGYNPSDIIDANLPVNNVSWSDIRVFIQKLNSRNGKTYRLPYEDEWEFAARGGNQSKKFRYSGSDNALDVAWCKENSELFIHPVGSKQPNELGIYDMCGNVSEWIGSIVPNKESITTINRKRLKGQNFYERADNLSLNSTNSAPPLFSYKNIGFRLILDSDQNNGNDAVHVVTNNVDISKNSSWGETFLFNATIYNRQNASECGFMIGTSISKMQKYEVSLAADKYSYWIGGNEYENSVIYYCAYAIDGWDLVKGEVKTFNTGK